MAVSPPAVDDSDADPSEVKTKLKNSRWGFVSRIAFAAGALLTIAVLSISLMVEDFGRFSGVVALVAIVGGLARMGSSELMLERLAREPDELRAAYGRALGTSVSAVALCIGVLAVLRPVLLPEQSLFFVLALGIGELLHIQSIDISIKLLNSLGKFRRAALQAVASVLIRLGAVSTLLIWPAESLNDVGLRYAAAGIIVWLAGLASVIPVVGRPKLSVPTTIGEIRRGGTIAVGQTSLTVSTRIDQTLLLRAGLEGDAGIYSFGARIVFNAMLPAQALLEVVYPDFFRAGAEGDGSAHALARRLAKPLVIYGAFAALVLLGVAPIVEWLLDASFQGVAWVIVAMAGFPAIRITQSLAGDVLTGLGAHAIRSNATIAAGVLNILMNLALIPSLGWRGAAISTYAADIFLLLAFIFAANRRREH